MSELNPELEKLKQHTIETFKLSKEITDLAQKFAAKYFMTIETHSKMFRETEQDILTMIVMRSFL